MFSSRSKEVPLFKTPQEELNYWKESCFELDDKCRRLMSCELCPAKDNTKDPAAKQLKIDDTSMDPLKKLKEDEILEVMKYLNSEELLQAMEVSKGWKTFIEGQKLLMNRAMEETIVKPNLSDFSLPLVNRLFSYSAEKRPYRYMEIPLELSTKVSAIERHASTLTSLTIKKQSNSRNSFYQPKPLLEHPTKYPRLKSLSIEDYDITNFRNYSFPAVENLKLKKVGDRELDIYNLRSFLRRCPATKQLEMEYYGENNYMFSSDDDYYYDDDDTSGYYRDRFSRYDFYGVERRPRRVKKDSNQPKIERIIINQYFALFIRDQQDSLQFLDCHYTGTDDMRVMASDLRVLKTLIIRNIVNDYGRGGYSVNESIERLEIWEVRDDVENDQQIIQDFIRVMHSLKELVFRFHVSADLIQFLGSNMNSLKKLFCPKLDEEASLAYQQLRRDSHFDNKTTFEVVIVRL